jgi:hypothetical protein
MTGPRDLSAEWAAVYGAAYVREHYEHHRLTGEHIVDDEGCDRLAGEAKTVADLAIAALARVEAADG